MNTDFLIIGAGIFGLTIARALSRDGHDVTVVDQAGPGAGASGGVLGALMPHMPNSWNAKKQFQFDALATLQSYISELEDETGISAGYDRIGRVMPIRRPGFLQQTQDRSRYAQENWGSSYTLSVKEAAYFSGIISPDIAPLGLASDTLSARVNPKQYINCLASAIAQSGVDIIPNVKIESSHLKAKKFAIDKGDMSFDKAIIASGYQSFSLLQQLGYPDLGGGIWGQAAILKPNAPIPDDLPLIYDNGTYIIFHANGSVAVGSTSFPMADDITPAPLAEETQRLVTTAQNLCPLLADAELVSEWSGVRPKAWGRDPIIGWLPDHPDLFIASGGFKISFGIAHKTAQSVCNMVHKKQADEVLPETFGLHHHLVIS